MFNDNRCLLNSLVVECWLRVWEVPGSIPIQRPRHTKDVIKMVPVVPLISTEHSKGKIIIIIMLRLVAKYQYTVCIELSVHVWCVFVISHSADDKSTHKYL